jgi:microsomal dipeptidase-like Zn-dependent dipeptidase
MANTYKTKHPKEKGKQKHCPTCNSYIKHIDGLPAYICSKCVALATDKDGKPITFKTITESGNGIQGVYTDGGKLYRSRTCYIKGLKCKVEETNIGIVDKRVTAKK